QVHVLATHGPGALLEHVGRLDRERLALAIAHVGHLDMGEVRTPGRVAVDADLVEASAAIDLVGAAIGDDHVLAAAGLEGLVAAGADQDVVGAVRAGVDRGAGDVGHSHVAGRAAAGPVIDRVLEPGGPAAGDERVAAAVIDGVEIERGPAAAMGVVTV